MEEWKKKDPIEKMVKLLKQKKAVTKKKLLEIEKEISANIDSAAKFAEDSPFPQGRRVV